MTADRLLVPADLWGTWTAAREFAAAHLPDDVDERDARWEFSRDGWRRCAQYGLTGLPAPTRYGGSDAGLATTMAAFDGFGYACRDGGLLFSVGAHLWSVVMTIARFGNAEQRARYLPGLISGDLIGAHAMTEPETGSDAFALTSSAEPTDRGWLLNGRKRFITNAPTAELFVVFARVPGRTGPFGLVCLLVDAATPGLTVGKPARKAGLRTSPTAELTFADCLLGEEALIGTVGMGMAIFSQAILLERACIMAPALGAMHRQLDRCLALLRDLHSPGGDHRRTRPDEPREPGKPPRPAWAMELRGDPAVVADLVGEMASRLHTSRLLAYATAHEMDAGRSGAVAASLVKTKVSEAFLANSLDARRIAADCGGASTADADREVMDASGSLIYSGTNEIQRDIIGREAAL